MTLLILPLEGSFKQGIVTWRKTHIVSFDDQTPAVMGWSGKRLRSDRQVRMTKPLHATCAIISSGDGYLPRPRSASA